MRWATRFSLLSLLASWSLLTPSLAQSTHNPTWWAKFHYLVTHGIQQSAPGATVSLNVGANVDMSNECGPQSETYITLNPASPNILAAGSNEIFRLPMRGYFSSDGGLNWGGVDLPLPPAIGAHGVDFGSDPSLAFDTRGNTFYSYIVVFFSTNFHAVNGTEMAVARSSDGGQTYPHVTFFEFSGGVDHFNDKPMITADTNPSSPFRDNVYVAWDAAKGGSGSGGIRVAVSNNHGETFSARRIDHRPGPGLGIGAVPFVGPNGQVYVAWNDFKNNVIAFNRSFDAGVTWGSEHSIAAKQATFDVAIPAESFRRALVYPACDADRSTGPHRGRLYCSWMDLTAVGTTDIFVSFSDDQGTTWSAPAAVTDQLSFSVDRFNQWLSSDPITGSVNVSFYDTRNDTTGQRFKTDVYFTNSNDGGLTWSSPNTRVTTVSSNEHDCNGLFPCLNGIDYGNQQGDYEGLVSFGGVSHPIWTDSRDQLVHATGCFTDRLMEEVFTATVQ
jgi:hypothetical protein